MPDEFRPLSSRGNQHALELGRWMKKEEMVPEHIVSSPVLKSWQTVSSVCYELDIDKDAVDFDDRIYQAKESELCQVISATDSDINSLLLVGHNPGLEDLFNYLLKDTAEFPDGKVFSTATLCVLFLHDWADMEKNSACLSQIVHSK